MISGSFWQHCGEQKAWESNRKRLSEQGQLSLEIPTTLSRTYLAKRNLGPVQYPQRKLEQQLRKTFSDKQRHTPITISAIMPPIQPPEHQIDKRWPTWNEVEYTVRLARSSSAPGINGIPRHPRPSRVPLEANGCGLEASHPTNFQCNFKVLPWLSYTHTRTTLLQYVDDLMVCSPTAEQCEKNTVALLKHLCAHGNKASQSKLQFVQQQVTFLSHIITAEGKSLSPKHAEAIQRLPKSQTKKQLISQTMTFRSHS